MPPWRIVVPPKTLHEFADVNAIEAFAVKSKPSDRHFCANLKQLCRVPGIQIPHGTQRREVDGIMLLSDISWIKHDERDEIVAVVTRAVNALLASRTDLAAVFGNEKTLIKLCAGKYRSNGILKDAVQGWRALKSPAGEDLIKYAHSWLDGDHKLAKEAHAESRTVEVQVAAAAVAAEASAQLRVELAEGGKVVAVAQMTNERGRSSAIAMVITEAQLAVSACLSDETAAVQRALLEQQALITQQQQLLIQQQQQLLVVARGAGEQAAKRHKQLLMQVPVGGIVTVPISGGRVNLMRVMETRVGSSEASKSTNYARANVLGQMREQVAGGQEHVPTLMMYDARVHSEAYKTVGTMTQVTVSLDEARGVCRELTGQLGRQWSSFMKTINLCMPSRQDRLREDKKTWHECMTGKIVIPDPKRPGKTITAAYMRILDLHRVLQRTIRLQELHLLLEWPPNVPASEVWVMVCEDKGGESDKLLLKFICIKNPDCVYHTVILGMMDKLKAEYDFIKLAFGPLFEQMSVIRRCGLCVRSAWRQQLPFGIVRRNINDEGQLLEDDYPIVDPRPLKCSEYLRRLEIKLQGRSRMHSGRIPLPEPKRSQSSLPTLLLGPGRASSHRVASPIPMGTLELEMQEPCPQPLPPFALEVHKGAIIAMECEPVEPVDLDAPPSTCRPDCLMCANPMVYRTSGRAKYAATAVPGCARAKREAAASRGGYGPVRPIFSHHPTEPPRLHGCTWSSSCTVCKAHPEGQLAALQRQWEACDDRTLADRRVRLFFGGDILSIMAQMGLGGPSSKKFCIFCLGSLHLCNCSGVVHRRSNAPSQETRLRGEADPPARVSSSAIGLRARALKTANDEFDKKMIEYDQKPKMNGIGSRQACEKKPKKPEPADYDSCIHEPLLYFDGPPERSTSTTPLHLLLGLVLGLVNEMEAELKQGDAAFASARGEKMSDPKVQIELEVKEALLVTLRAELPVLVAKASDAITKMEMIADDSLNAEAVKRGSKARSQRAGYTPEPLEDEYRQLRLERVATCKIQHETEQKINKEEAEVLKLRNKDAGPFLRAFYALFDQLKLERQAYHNQALNGNDCKKVLQPQVAHALSRLLDGRLVCELGVTTINGIASVSLNINVTSGLGDSARADRYELILLTLGEAASLWTRVEPLCDHEVARFKALCDEYAELFVCLFPDKEPTPKLHIVLYHVYGQMGWLGSSGQFHEGVIESKHVRDNELVRRFCAVKNPERRILLRSRIHWQSEAPGAINIRAMRQQQQARRRVALNVAERAEREVSVAVRMAQLRDNFGE